MLCTISSGWSQKIKCSCFVSIPSIFDLMQLNLMHSDAFFFIFVKCRYNYGGTLIKGYQIIWADKSGTTSVKAWTNVNSTISDFLFNGQTGLKHYKTTIQVRTFSWPLTWTIIIDSVKNGNQLYIRTKLMFSAFHSFVSCLVWKLWLSHTFVVKFCPVDVFDFLSQPHRIVFFFPRK